MFQAGSDPHLSLEVGLDLFDKVNLWIAKQSQWEISRSDNQTFHLTRSRLTCFNWKEGIVSLQRNVCNRLQKEVSKVWYNKIICADILERKLSDMFVGLRSHLDVEPDNACRTRKIHNGIKVDSTFWWWTKKILGRVGYIDYHTTHVYSAQKVFVRFQNI